MPITHKFLNHTFQNGFETNDAILSNIPYQPEVIFIGTFNHGWEWNNADFYYGRGMYMWCILSNLFTYNNNTLLNPRVGNNDPTIVQIFEICENAKITFADIVKGTANNVLTEQIGNSILVNDEYYWNTYSDGQLEKMAGNGWLDDNVPAIISYINATPSIKHVYFTFKSGIWLIEKKSQIVNNINIDDVCSIISPSGNGFGNLLPGYPTRAESIAHSWIWNGLPNLNPINRDGYGHLNHDWLRQNGVEPNNF